MFIYHFSERGISATKSKHKYYDCYHDLIRLKFKIQVTYFQLLINRGFVCSFTASFQRFFDIAHDSRKYVNTSKLKLSKLPWLGSTKFIGEICSGMDKTQRFWRMKKIKIIKNKVQVDQLTLFVRLNRQNNKY